jgi:hypothetical protein
MTSFWDREQASMRNQAAALFARRKIRLDSTNNFHKEITKNNALAFASPASFAPRVFSAQRRAGTQAQMPDGVIHMQQRSTPNARFNNCKKMPAQCCHKFIDKATSNTIVPYGKNGTISSLRTVAITFLQCRSDNGRDDHLRTDAHRS